MTSLGKQFLFVVMLCGVTVLVSSCNQNQRAPDSHAKPVKPSPEEAYKVIIETFRRRMLDTPLGFVIDDPTGRSTLTGSNSVEDELITPTSKDQPHRAVLTVTTESRYSLRRIKEGEEKADQDKAGGTKSANDDSAGRDADELLARESTSVTNTPTEPGKNATNATPAKEDVLQPLEPAADVRKYELQYKDGRWVLVTELDKMTELSIKNAFDSALATQVP